MDKKKHEQPAKLKIRKGDLVKVIAGDSKGTQGKITELLLKVPTWYQNIQSQMLLIQTVEL